ncbi:MAG: PEP-CTERM sorting domain-containing protein [Akkermansiaceae bacterium]
MAFSSAASAQSITSTLTSVSPSESVRGTFDNGTVINDKNSGLLNFSNADFEAFCAEPFQFINVGEAITYQVAPATSYANADAVSKVITAFKSSSMDLIQATGAQWAIWELVAESAGSYDITIAIDTPFADSVDGVVSTAAQKYLDNYSSFASTDVTFLTNSTRQDMVTWSSVLEPSSALLCGFGLLALARRRR